MDYCLTLLLFTLSVTHGWILQTNVDRMTPGKTKNVQLVCKQDGNLENDQRMDKVNGISITKMDSFGTKKTFAEIHVLSRDPWCEDDSVDVEASLKHNGQAFLKVTWSVANDNTEGAYGCEISGYNSLDNYATISVRPSVKINKKRLTEDDVINHIRKMTQGHIRKQKELELEIVSLKRFITENLQSTRKRIDQIDDEMKAKLSTLQNTIESTCSAKSELKDQVSEMKNFTINQILTVRNDNQKELDNFSSMLQKTSSTCEKQYSEMAQNMSNLIVHFTSGVDSLRKKNADISSHLSSTSNAMTRQIRSVDNKYGNEIKTLNSEFTRKLSVLERKCICTTPAPTTPKPSPKPKIVSEWPRGSYALVRPETGCANLDALQTVGRSLFRTVPYASTGFHKVEKGVDKTKELSLILQAGSKKTAVQYCVKDTSISSLSSPSWPKGTYCIALIGGSCARGFTSGYMNYHFKKGGKYVGQYMMRYCCRADQKASVPIKFPKTIPFYLYRNKGTCQQVEGMTVKGHVLEVKMRSGMKVALTSKHADVSKKKTSIYVCHYQPSWCSR